MMAFGNQVVLIWTFLAAIVAAKTVSYDFDIGWVTANPDGAYERTTIGINGQWPLPYIRADVGDQVVVNAHNSLQNRSVSLHFHGLYMNGSTEMDGPVGVSQCSIPFGSSMTYKFNVSLDAVLVSDKTNSSRSLNLAHTGITHTMMASTRTDCVVLLLSTTPRIRSRIFTTRKWF